MNRPRLFSSPVAGVMLILIGGVWLASNLFDWKVDFEVLWPIFLLIPGLLLWIKYLFSRDNHQILIPANILVFLSITFFFNMIATEWWNYNEAWVLTVSMYSTGPVAIAFWITWGASGKKQRYLVPAMILTIITACIATITVPVALFNNSFFAEVSRIGFPALLILIGLMIVFGPIWANAFGKPEPEDNSTKFDDTPNDNLVDEADIVEVEQSLPEAEVEETAAVKTEELVEEGEVVPEPQPDPIQTESNSLPKVDRSIESIEDHSDSNTEPAEVKKQTEQPTGQHSDDHDEQKNPAQPTKEASASLREADKIDNLEA